MKQLTYPKVFTTICDLNAQDCYRLSKILLTAASIGLNFSDLN